LIDQLPKTEGSFRKAEQRLGDSANHERLGQLLLLNANMGQEIAEVIAKHHNPGNDPGDLACLLPWPTTCARIWGWVTCRARKGGTTGRS
jgi:hypothetical protein